MAIKDVREYFYTMQAQYLEMKSDLADYNQAFQDGHITEEQLDIVKADIAEIEKNYQRLAFIVHLLGIRKKRSKKQLLLDTALEKELATRGADNTSVETENKEKIEQIKAKLDILIDNKE